MKRPSPKFLMTVGLTLQLVTMLLAALYLGLVPDRIGAVRDGRAALAEAITANSAAMITRADLRRLEADLKLVVERNDDILSAALRRANGQAVIVVGDHDAHWVDMAGEHSTDSQLKVPIFAGNQKWGDLELRCRALAPPGWRGLLEDSRAQLILFMALVGFVVFYAYLTRMLRQLDPSKAVPGRVRSALDTLAEGLLGIDRDGYILLANRAFATLAGRTPEALVGTHVSRLPWLTRDGAALEESAYPWLGALDRGTSQRSGIVHLRDGESKRRTFMVNASPVLAAGDKPLGVLVGFDDVTQLEEKEIELRRSKEEAEAANRAKSDFLANVSHEIRTPMNAILGFTEILKRGYVTDERDWKKHLSTIHSSGKHLLELINDLLDLSKIEARSLELERVVCSPHTVVGEVVRVLAMKAREKGIGLDFDIEGPLPQTVATDPSRLRQVVTNLIGNAIKFTDQGGVRVVLRMDRSAADPRLAIDIIDTGVGLSEDKLEAIFDPFVQADASVTRRFGGTGLGLAISRRLARALGGDIRVRSELGAGSEFTVTVDPGPLEGVPMLEAHELSLQPEQAPEKARRRWRFPDRRVLVVDDGAQNRDLVRLVLEDAGLEVAAAENGSAALEIVLERPPDIVLMDIHMPVMDGFTATKILRERGYDRPILAMTANAMKGFEQEIVAGGFSGHVTKPIDIDALLESLAELLDGRLEASAGTRDDASDQARDGPGTSVRVAPAAPIVSRLPTSDPRFAAIVKEFVEQLHERLDAMELARREGDFGQLADLAHYLKGAGGTVGLDALTAPAAALERHARDERMDRIEPALAELRRLAGRIRLAPEEGQGIEAQAASDEPGDEAAPAGQNTHSPIVSRLPTGDPRFRAIVEEFVDQLGGHLDAVDLAWKDKDFDKLAHLAHYLKGAAGTVGFREFTEPARTLEALARSESQQGTEDTIGELRALAARVVIAEGESVSESAVA